MYWINAITASGIEARLNNISDDDLSVLIPLLGELGAFTSFGETGSPVVLGGCLGRSEATDVDAEAGCGLTDAVILAGPDTHH